MFGFLRPAHPIRTWRQSYARVCQYQHAVFGLTSLPFLSYEAAFLYSAATDCGLSPAPDEAATTCCRLRRVRNPERHSDCRLATFAAAFGLLLAGVKLRDDVTDSGRWLSRLLWWKYARQVGRAERWLESACPGINAELTQCLSDYAALERRGPDTTLDALMETTGRAFGIVFERCVQWLSPASLETCDDTPRRFRKLGHHIGAAIIAWDCAADFEADRIHGHFNPLQTQDDVAQSVERCRLELSAAGWLCPEAAISRQVIASVLHRIARRGQPSPAICSPSRLERWGLIRQRGYSYASCDGCEVMCAAAQVADCCAGGGDCIACCGPHAYAPELCGHDCPGSDSARAKRQKMPGDGADHSHLHGLNAITCECLQPHGFVTVAGGRIPAISADGTTIPPDTTVRIVRTDPFGVSVVVVPG